jgi:hypothetical protein
MNFESLKQSKLSQTKEKEFVLNSRATGPKSGRAQAGSGLRGPAHVVHGLLGMDWQPTHMA